MVSKLSLMFCSCIVTSSVAEDCFVGNTIVEGFSIYIGGGVTTWDDGVTGGTPEPYIKVKVTSCTSSIVEQYQTAIEYSNYPDWDTTFTFLISAYSSSYDMSDICGIQFESWEADIIQDDDYGTYTLWWDACDFEDTIAEFDEININNAHVISASVTAIFGDITIAPTTSMLSVGVKTSEIDTNAGNNGGLDVLQTIPLIVVIVSSLLLIISCVFVMYCLHKSRIKRDRMAMVNGVHGKNAQEGDHDGGDAAVDDVGEDINVEIIGLGNKDKDKKNVTDGNNEHDISASGDYDDDKQEYSNSDMYDYNHDEDVRVKSLSIGDITQIGEKEGDELKWQERTKKRKKHDKNKQRLRKTTAKSAPRIGTSVSSATAAPMERQGRDGDVNPLLEAIGVIKMTIGEVKELQEVDGVETQQVKLLEKIIEKVEMKEELSIHEKSIVLIVVNTIAQTKETMSGNDAGMRLTNLNNILSVIKFDTT